MAKPFTFKSPTLICEDCGNECARTGGLQKVCPDCRTARHKQCKKNWMAANPDKMAAYRTKHQRLAQLEKQEREREAERVDRQRGVLVASLPGRRRGLGCSRDTADKLVAVLVSGTARGRWGIPDSARVGYLPR